MRLGLEIAVARAAGRLSQLAGRGGGTTLPGKIVAADENKKRWKDIYTAGHGVGNIDDVPAAADLCRRLIAQYRDAKKKVPA